VSHTLIIGDVHGCLEELDELLAKAGVTSSDSVIFVGDLIGRGPDSIRVLDRVLQLNARAVQGNHERQLLQLMDTGTSSVPPLVHESRLRLLERLEPRHLQWLRGLPLYLDLTEHAIWVVHAGLVPGKPLAEQDPWVLTHVRSFDSQGRPSAQLGDESWAVAYAGPAHVVFGHSAQRGIQLHEFATGLDSGCVYGGSLTGLLLHEDQRVPPIALRPSCLVSVAAHEAHCSVH
jgi:hypothetical protein